ncbi:MAG: cystathionine beta-synthase, partial [Lewinella sp.]
MLNYVKDVLDNIPADWLNLTTHRLDIYEEKLAKTQFLEQFEALYQNGNAGTSALKGLPTAFDYIRLGHPLSCLLEWVVADRNKVKPDNVISFSSATMPVMAILRTNLLTHKNTRILYTGELPVTFDAEVLRRVYGYQFELALVETPENVAAFDGSTIFLSHQKDIREVVPIQGVDFTVSVHAGFGSVLVINGAQNEAYVSAIQHVRRRETIAMTPANCFAMLSLLVAEPVVDMAAVAVKENTAFVLDLVRENAGTTTQGLISSSGLSIQYAILMGLIHYAQENHPDKAIKIVVPPNCYGGTNDQARRVAASIDNVEIVDLPVDGDDDMVRSIDRVLTDLAAQDAVPYIIAEIPTNPRVEVPHLVKLKQVLSEERRTLSGERAIDPVFILDQTFCPNVQFLGEGGMLSSVRTVSFSSGSKFPSGGLCTAGYCIGNENTAAVMEKIAQHLRLCDNEATDLQVEILAKQLPSMKQRIAGAYKN